MQLIDTHVHINFPDFRADLDEIAAAWRAKGVTHLVHSCVEPNEFAEMQTIADRFPEVFLAIGLHPLDMGKWSAATATQIEALAISDARVVAIGETGLDFCKSSDREVQEEAFWAQLEIAYRLKLPVIIHCREAAERTAELIRTFLEQIGSVTGVMHCWAGTPTETQWFLDLGFYVSFSGIVTFKNAQQVKDSAMVVPSHRLLVETDCPFLTPVPKRKERRNQPANVFYIANHLAELRQEPLETLARQTTQNAFSLFKLSSTSKAVCQPEELLSAET